MEVMRQPLEDRAITIFSSVMATDALAESGFDHSWADHIDKQEPGLIIC
jgi:hypothetical protein